MINSCEVTNYFIAFETQFYFQPFYTILLITCYSADVINKNDYRARKIAGPPVLDEATIIIHHIVCLQYIKLYFKGVS